MFRPIPQEIIKSVKKQAGRESTRSLARKFGISQTTVYKIIYGQLDPGYKKPEDTREGFFKVELKEDKTWLI